MRYKIVTTIDSHGTGVYRIYKRFLWFFWIPFYEPILRTLSYLEGGGSKVVRTHKIYRSMREAEDAIKKYPLPTQEHKGIILYDANMCDALGRPWWYVKRWTNGIGNYCVYGTLGDCKREIEARLRQKRWAKFKESKIIDI